ncbi:MAG: sodium/proline symporter [Candidatus Neomarinimicrobiota bacterium]
MISYKVTFLFIYFIILICIGISSSKKVSSLSDYYVGGKKLGYWIAALSARATGESGWLLIGVTGMGALMGVSAFWIVVGEVLGVWVSWNFMAKKFKAMTDEYEAITITDFLVSHFNSNTNFLRFISASSLSLFVVIYVSAQIDITGKTFESFLDLNYYTGIAIGFGIVVFYIFSGGFIAVAWSDFFQGALMFFGLLILPPAIFFSLNETGSVIKGLNEIDPGLMNVWGVGGFSLINLATVLGLLSIGIGFMGSPQVYVRFIAIRDKSEIEKGKWVAVLYTFLTDISAVLIGILGRYMFTKADYNPELILGIGGEDVLSLVIGQVMPTMVIGIYIAAVLSAVMSTIDSLLVVASSAVTRDFYQKVFHPNISEKALIKISKKVTFFLALLALLVAVCVSVLSPTRTVFWFVIFGWSGIAATFCPVIIMSIFWEGLTEKGAIVSMFTGFVSVPFFKFVVPLNQNIGPFFEKLDVMLPSVLLAILLGVCVSFLSPD